MLQLASVLADLYARAPRGMRLGVEPMMQACARFGHPERELSVVHVAGTNGKGSVCSMIESVARRAGLCTGLYTSPHLARFAERIRIGGVPIDDARLIAVLGDVLARERELSFFEAATLAAFVAFREERVDLAVLEVGLGGRLDATNVVASPRACVVTRIALDHMEHLGNTLESIAREKAAIAKPGSPLILGPMPEAITSVIEGVARRRGAIPIRAEDDREARAFRGRAVLTLAGEHQKDNALVAHVVARKLGFDVHATEQGIAAAKWPGRLERITLEDGAVLFDAAHNHDGAAALAKALSETVGAGEPSALVFGALSDKDWKSMLDQLAPCVAVRAYARPKGRAAVDPGELASRHEGAIFEDALAAYTHAREAAGPDGLVVVCGSISLVGELRSKLLGEAADPPVAL